MSAASPESRATIWLDKETMRVLGTDQWHRADEAGKCVLTRTRFDYDAPIDPRLFVAEVPPGTRVVDRRGRAAGIPGT